MSEAYYFGYLGRTDKSYVASLYQVNFMLFLSFADLLGHTVKRFSHTGKLEITLGTPNKKGTGLTPQYQFDQVADLDIGEDGEVYIVDGDGGMNNRLLKLDASKCTPVKVSKKQKTKTKNGPR